MHGRRATTKDLNYQREVDELIPGAVAYTNEQMPPRPELGSRTEWHKLWDKIFSAAMDRATLARGIRQQNHQ